MDAEKVERLLTQNIAKAQALEYVLMAVLATLTKDQRRRIVPLIRRAAERTADSENELGPIAQASFDETYAIFFRMLEE